MTGRTATIISSFIAGAVAIAGAATGPVPVSNLPPPQLQALSGIDIVPPRTQIEMAFGPSPFDDLLALSRDPNEDPGVRLRAIRALTLYPGDPTRLALTADLAALGAPGPGTDTLYLRALIEALGVVGQSADVATLVPYLDFEPSQDIRAATANSLRVIGDTTARDPLWARLNRENKDQVRFAIQRALRELGQPL